MARSPQDRVAALAVISSADLHENISARLEAMEVPCSFAFELGDFWEMLHKRQYEIVMAETAAMSMRPASFLARVRKIRRGIRVIFLIDSDEPFPEGVNSDDVLEVPAHSADLEHVLGKRTVDSPASGRVGTKAPVRSSRPGARTEIVGSSPAMEGLRAQVEMFAPVESYTLILGESGTGKERVARAIHAASPRRSGPFVALNCGSIPSEIIESELFGHLKGSFTGADRDRHGAFEQAEGGTLFLDEIGTMRLDHQVRLLRVLQERQVAPVGSNKVKEVNVRVLAATNADLIDLMEAGKFREDLFYRLNVLMISIPPLREHREDIPELAGHFVHESAQRLGMGEKKISEAAMESLVAHPWKGNVRELENAIEHALVVSRGRSVIERLDLPDLIGDRRKNVDRGALRLTPDGIDLNDTVSQIEREMILQSLALAHGNKSKAAELLHLKRTTFVEKMKRYELGEGGPSLSV